MADPGWTSSAAAGWGSVQSVTAGLAAVAPAPTGSATGTAESEFAAHAAEEFVVAESGFADHWTAA